MDKPEAARAFPRTPVIRATPEEIAAHKAVLKEYERFAKLKPGPKLWDQLTPPE